MPHQPLLTLTDSGLYCEAGNFYIDPWGPVERAVITHAHSDHARLGARAYLAAEGNARLLATRLGDEAPVDILPYREILDINGVNLSFHPAGHILGSAQVRLEHHGEVWVVSGDYKIEPDPTCPAFEPVQCHTFITEATYGLPIYRWPDTAAIFGQINSWWRANQERGKTSMLYCYALGKAQRILAGVDSSIGPVYTHGAVENLTQDYRAEGIALPPTMIASDAPRKTKWSEALVLAPPSANGTPWLRRFGSIATGFASGWMAVRGMRRRKAIDRGFILSDHSDWTGLLTAIVESHAERVLVTHGYSAMLSRYLVGKGIDSSTLNTRFEGELQEASDVVAEEAE
jgi:putative mRNA 3-end processing factor